MTSRYPHPIGDNAPEAHGATSSRVSDGTRKARVVIVGGGFAGVSAYRTLRCHKDRLQLTVVSDNASFVHIPLIHEVATGALPSDVVHWPLTRYIDCPKGEFVHGRVTSVDADKRSVEVESPDGTHQTLSYDFLVLAAGSKPSMANIVGADDHAYTLRSLSDATKLREHICDCFQKAEKTNDSEEKQALLTFAVVGAGVTGLELVGELSNLFANELSKKFPNCCGVTRILLINNRDTITIGNKEWVSEEARKRIAALPLVEVVPNTNITAISKEGFRTVETFTPSRTVIWTGGVSAVPMQIAAQPAVEHDERGRVVVTPALTLPNHEDCFVVGDEAHIPKEDGSAYGMQAQFAVREGKHAAKNILYALDNKQLQPFRSKELAFLIPIGKHFGIAEIFGFRLTGFLAWHLAHIIYVVSVVDWRLKLTVAWKWLYHLMRRRKTL